MKIKPQHIGFTVWAAAVSTSALLVFMALNMYPVPDGDAIYFLPAIKAYGAGGILENKLADLSFETDPERLGRFLFYTPGFPLTVGSLAALLGLSTYNGILLLLSFIRAASVLLFTKSLLIFAERQRLLACPFYGFILSMLVVSNGLFLLPSNGRPEILSSLIVSGSLLAALAIHSKIARHLTLCLGIGLLFPVSLANGIIACSFYLLYLLSDIRKPAIRIVLLASSLLVGGLMLGVSYLIAGVSLADGLKGLSIHSGIQLARSDTSPYLLILYSKSWLVFGLLALANLIICHSSGRIMSARRASPVDRLWLASALIVLGFSIYSFGLRAAPAHYNFYAFLSIYQLLSLRLLVNSEASNLRLLKYGLTGLVAMGLLLSLADPMRATMLTPYYLTSGATYAEARERFNALEMDRCSLAYSSGLLVLDESQAGSNLNLDRASRVRLSQRISTLERHKSCLIALVQEVNNQGQSPADMVMIADFSDTSPWTSRLKMSGILHSPKGYSFRAYRKDLPIP